jgi:uncharacterized membrane protein YjfL (UPF0719 family)
MSEDEVLVLLFSGVTSLVCWGTWLYRALAVDQAFGAQSQRQLLFVCPLLCAVILFAVLRVWASHDVRDDWRYLIFYCLMGFAWVGVAAWVLFPWLGLHVVPDAIERRNLAAAIGVVGGLCGYTLAFAGGNIGDGPGWWVVVFSSGLATITLTLAWLLLSALSHIADAVTIDRDLAAAIRLTGFLVAVGMVCGRGAAGDWVSADATIADFVRIAWMVVPLLILAIGFDRFGRPSIDSPSPSVSLYGVLPFVLSIGMAAVWIVQAGAW